MTHGGGPWGDPNGDWGTPTTYGSRPPVGGGRRRRRGGTGPLLAIGAVVVIGVVAALAAVRISHRDHSTAASAHTTPHGSAASGAPTTGDHRSGSPSPAATAPVHVSLFQGDGQTYGIGMPIIAQFSKKVTDGHAFDKAVKVTV